MAKVRKVIKVLLIIVVVFILVFVMPIAFGWLFYLPQYNKEQTKYNNMMEQFAEICEYVKENEEAYIEFSLSRAELMTDTNRGKNISATGDMQPLRDIVMKDVSHAEYFYDENDHPVVYYVYDYDDDDNRYGINVRYCKDIGKEAEYALVKDDELCYVGDDIRIDIYTFP